MTRPPPRFTRTHTLFPYPTLFRSPRALTSAITVSAAACTLSPARRRCAAISCATPTRRKNSPAPVHETAHARSSAQVPAPTIGESPTRPQRLPVTPPVEEIGRAHV